MHLWLLFDRNFQLYVQTYSARAGVGNPALKRHPLVVGSVSVGIRPQEHPPDVGHVVHAHSRAFEDVTEEEKKEEVTHQESGDGGEEEGEGAERTEVREMNKGDGSHRAGIR